MDLFNEDDIKTIIKRCGVISASNLRWFLKNYSEDLIGYLGEHLSLTVIFKTDVETELKFFVKCIPRYDKWKANYLRETCFFNKEYVMLGDLFTKFSEGHGLRKFRPKLLLAKEEFFVFEEVTLMGYTMPSNLEVLTYDELTATVAALARFHAQSYAFEENKSKALKRPYKIWEEYSEYLSEPSNGKPWRDTGRKAFIDFVKVYSKFKSIPNFASQVEKEIIKLYEQADDLMKPSSKYRNVVIHRDIWSNNIFLKKLEGRQMHALLVDFQTVLYCAPMLDLSSLIYFNTTRNFRSRHTEEIVEYYYRILSEELNMENVDVDTVIDRQTIKESYDESLVFAMTQAAIIVPIIAMTNEKRKQTFGDPEACQRVNNISRSQEFIDLAREKEKYRHRVTELFDEILETYVFPSAAENGIK